MSLANGGGTEERKRIQRDELMIEINDVFELIKNSRVWENNSEWVTITKYGRKIKQEKLRKEEVFDFSLLPTSND